MERHDKLSRDALILMDNFVLLHDKPAIPSIANRIGKKYFHWTILEYAGYILRGDNPKRHYYIKCQCDCGRSEPVIRQISDIIKGKSRHCIICGIESSATKRTMHGQNKKGEKSLTYVSWQAMLTRCNNPNIPQYKNYGGRGIKVCERWHKFENFYEDMGERPGKEFSVERLDNNRGYFPDNCVYATRIQQQNNTSKNRFVVYKKEKMTVAQCIRLNGFEKDFLSQRIHRFRKLNPEPVGARLVLDDDTLYPRWEILKESNE